MAMSGLQATASFRVSFDNASQIIDIENQDEIRCKNKCDGLDETWQKMEFTNGPQTRRYAVRVINGTIEVADSNKHLRRFKALFCCFFRNRELFTNVEKTVSRMRGSQCSGEHGNKPVENLTPSPDPIDPADPNVILTGSPGATIAKVNTVTIKPEVKQEAIVSASQISSKTSAFCQTVNPVFAFDLDDTLYVSKGRDETSHSEPCEQNINQIIQSLQAKFPDATFIAITSSSKAGTKKKAEKSGVDLKKFQLVHTIFKQSNAPVYLSEQTPEGNNPIYLAENIFSDVAGSDSISPFRTKGQRYLNCCKHLDINPSERELVFIDNEQTELNAMQAMANTKNLRLLNLHYRGASLKRAQFNKSDPKWLKGCDLAAQAKKERDLGREIIEYTTLRRDNNDPMKFEELEEYLDCIKAHIGNLDQDDQQPTIQAVNKFLSIYEQLEADKTIIEYRNKNLLG